MRAKKIIKRIVHIAAVLFLIIAGAKGLSYILKDDTASYSRLMMHEFYAQDNIDILFLGASHCLRAVNPYIIDDATGKNSFVASVPDEWMDASFALLKEADHLYDIDEVFVEMSARLALKTLAYKERKSLTSTYNISDYMKPSFNKLNFLLNASSADQYVNNFWPARRYWEKITDFQYINTIMSKKSTSKYTDYTNYYANQDLNGRGVYQGKGFLAMFDKFSEHKFFIKTDYKNIEVDEIAQDWINSVMEIIDYCEKHNIKLTLFTTPVSHYDLSAKGNYDDYTAFIKELIDGKDVRYTDFNLIKEEYFPYHQINYSDGHHMNQQGAEAFSAVLADYINGNLPEGAFHTSAAEKLQTAKPDYYGIFYTDDYQEQNRIFHLVSNIPEYFEYQVEITTSDKETHLLQAYDTNSIISVSFEMIPGSAIRVTFRPAGSSGEGTLIKYPHMGAIE